MVLIKEINDTKLSLSLSFYIYTSTQHHTTPTISSHIIPTRLSLYKNHIPSAFKLNYWERNISWWINTISPMIYILILVRVMTLVIFAPSFPNTWTFLRDITIVEIYFIKIHILINSIHLHTGINMYVINIHHIISDIHDLYIYYLYIN